MDGCKFFVLNITVVVLNQKLQASSPPNSKKKAQDLRNSKKVALLISSTQENTLNDEVNDD